MFAEVLPANSPSRQLEGETSGAHKTLARLLTEVMNDKGRYHSLMGDREENGSGARAANVNWRKEGYTFVDLFPTTGTRIDATFQGAQRVMP